MYGQEYTAIKSYRYITSASVRNCKSLSSTSPVSGKTWLVDLSTLQVCQQNVTIKQILLRHFIC